MRPRGLRSLVVVTAAVALIAMAGTAGTARAGRGSPRGSARAGTHLPARAARAARSARPGTKAVARRPRGQAQHLARRLTRRSSRARHLVADAIRNTDPAYLRRVVDSRNVGSKNRGSHFAQAVTVDALLAAHWRPYTHPAVGKGVTAYVAPIPGRVGMIDLRSLPPSTPIKLEDYKNVGHLSAIVDWHGALPAVDHTVLLVGRDGGKDVVFTVHPGDPVKLPSIRDPSLQGRVVTASEAIARGFTMAKANVIGAPAAHGATGRPSTAEHAAAATP